MSIPTRLKWHDRDGDRVLLDWSSMAMTDPRVPRRTRRALRAAIHNAQQGKELREGETLDTLRGRAAFIAMTDQQEGERLKKQIDEIQS